MLGFALRHAMIVFNRAQSDSAPFHASPNAGPLDCFASKLARAAWPSLMQSSSASRSGSDDGNGDLAMPLRPASRLRYSPSNIRNRLAPFSASLERIGATSVVHAAGWNV